MLTPADLGFSPGKFPSFRSGQYETIERIAESDKRFTLVIAPVGAGKSATVVGSAIYMSARAAYLTVTKPLQSQLDNDFSSMGLVDIRGHSNYPCASVSYDDETGELADLECVARHSGRCHYADLCALCQSAALGTNTNYAHWIQIGQSDNPHRLGPFDLLICDEAHRAHDLVCERAGVKLYPRQVRDLLGLSLPTISWEQIDTWQQWAHEALDVARKKYVDKRMDKRQKALLTRLGVNLRRFVDDSKTGEWVVKKLERSERSGYHLIPLWGDKYAEPYLFRSVPRVLLVSATVDSSDRVHLGIPVGTYDTIEVDSTFPVVRRPFIYIPVHVPGSEKALRIDHRMTQRDRDTVVSVMDRFIEARLDRKGLIHPRSYENSYRIQAESAWGVGQNNSGADIILTHKKGESEPVIREYKEADPPSVLCSPVIGEGHDFAGDLARYQVLWKMPFLPKKTDPLVAARAKADPKWELSQMAKTIEQEYGRATRSELDWSETACFDGHFEWLRKEARFHKWFRLAWKTMKPNEIPRPIKYKGDRQ